MGKNQTHKALSQSKHSGGGGGGDAEGLARGDGVDASFHTAEWHAARLAALQVERPSWEDWKQKQKDEENKYVSRVIHPPPLLCYYFYSSFANRQFIISKKFKYAENKRPLNNRNA
jgi:hypothetical protein